MADVLLTPPGDWAEELSAVQVPQLCLSYFPRGLEFPPGKSAADVARDLESGAWLVRSGPRPGGEPRFFRLGGSEFELRVRRQRARDSRAWLAVVLNVDPAHSVPPKAHRLVPSKVFMDTIWSEQQCDLAEIEERVHEVEKQLRRGARREELRSHGRLQRAVLSEYGDLETLIELLEQRPEDPEVTVTGHVAGVKRGRHRCVVVEPDTRETEGFRGRRVQLVGPDGRSYNTRVASNRNGRLEIIEPRDWSAEPGDEVGVSVVRPFGMRQNAEALANFRSGQAEGSWEDLARLLCRPGDLRRDEHHWPPLTIFYGDDDPEAPVLNDEQRSAVSGAVTSPHAFLVQGPPGTGKSEVICETVRQLVARGERVLLLAPTHVAVDEVLRRIGHKPGIRPLRITWRDDKVDERLRAYLPQNVGVDAAARIMRPGPDQGQTARWERELVAVGERIAQFDRLRDKVHHCDAAVQELRDAARAAAEAKERLAARLAAASEEMAELDHGIAAAERALGETSSLLSAAILAEEAAREQYSLDMEALRDAALELARSGELLTLAEEAEEEAAREMQAWESWYQGRLREAVATKDAAERSVTETHRAVVSVVAELAAARTHLEQVRSTQGAFGRFAERLQLGSAGTARSAVAQAERELAQWESARAERGDALRRAAADLERITDNGRSLRAQRATLRDQRAEEREQAERRFVPARQAFREFVLIVHGELSAAADDASAQSWAHLGQALHTRVDASGAGRPQVTGQGDRIPAWGAQLVGWVELVLDELAAVAGESERCRTAHQEASRRHADWTDRQRQARIWTEAEVERLSTESEDAQADVRRLRGELNSLIAERDALSADLGQEDPASALTELTRRQSVLESLPSLAARWRELSAERSDEQLVEDMRHSLVRATNLVCATTKGIVGRGSELVRHTDYDTLIVDEASRVTESEFLIGAVKSRRWVLVGDEHQLPPHVDRDDEHFLHALTALHRTDRGAAPSLEQAVKDLAEIWAEDEELHRFRTDSVEEIALDLQDSGAWQATFRDRFEEAHSRFAKQGDKADRALLRSMIRYLMQSLFQRAVKDCPEALCRPLVWQRRMIPPLAEVVNSPVYGGRYRSPADKELTRVGLTPLVTRTFAKPGILIDTSRYRDAGDKPAESGHGFTNRRETELITQISQIYNDELSERGSEPVTASVLSFYRAQARQLDRRLRSRHLPMLDWQVIDVIDRIQGQQSDLVIISFTRARASARGGRPPAISPRYGQWLQDLRRLNVACTRARRALVMVGHADTLRQLGRGSRAPSALQAARFYDNVFELVESGEFLQVSRL